MKQPVRSDDELFSLLERTMNDVALLAPNISVVEERHDNRWMAIAAASVILVAGVAATGVVISNQKEPSRVGAGAQPTASSPSDTAPSSNPHGSSPLGSLERIPEDFPADVPRPDPYDSLTIMTADSVPVGWEFVTRGEPTTSVERCRQFAESFGASWTSTVETDEATSVLYAHLFTNSEWRVGIYCTDIGEFVVQVMRS